MNLSPVMLKLLTFKPNRPSELDDRLFNKAKDLAGELGAFYIQDTNFDSYSVKDYTPRSK